MKFHFQIHLVQYDRPTPDADMDVSQNGGWVHGIAMITKRAYDDVIKWRMMSLKALRNIIIGLRGNLQETMVFCHGFCHEL